MATPREELQFIIDHMSDEVVAKVLVLIRGAETPSERETANELLPLVSHSALLEVVKALRNDEPNFKFKPCSNCNGKCYAYGYGTHGAEPDWCDVCGGPGEVVDDDATNQMKLQLAIEVLSKHCG